MVLLLLIGIVWMLPLAFRQPDSITVLKDSGWFYSLAGEDSVKTGKENSEDDDPEDDLFYPGPPATQRELFFFDPNTISEQEWKKLGVKERTIRTILNYLKKGGRFRTPSDLKKIYGIREEDVRVLEPFVRIGVGGEMSNVKSETGDGRGEMSKVKREKREVAVVDINEADTTAFISLPGIGSKLAARIVAFREKLGGFYAVEQISEVYGISDSTFLLIKPYLRTANSSVRKIDINNATFQELSSHPYIRKDLAKTIIAYRNEHGPFRQTMDLKKIVIITEEIFERLKFYVMVKN